MDAPIEQNNSTQQPALSKNQLKNEAKRKEKLEKYLAKQEKLSQVPSSASNKNPTGSKLKSSSTSTDTPIIDIAEGEFKDVSKYDMLSSYNPKFVEKNWYSWWEAQGFFKPEVILDKNPNASMYVIPIPPPNVTGSLHLGHAMATSIQDSLIRWKRMAGHAALYIPGCDHAGISCQVVVEKHLKKTRNVTRHDLGRLAFIGEVWKWKDAFGDKIYSQLKRLGGSMDWSRARFTLDQSMNEAVTEAFVRLFEQGIIYRENRIVNWSSALQTAVSDLEVDHREIAGPIRLPAFGHDSKRIFDFGYLYSFAMKVFDAKSENLTEDEIIVSTTRPETIPGDVAIAINPEDPKYRSFHGRFVQHPIHKTKMPIICDSYADMSFGTGALKITPAHDPNDFEVSLRHKLPVVIIFDANNRLNDNAGPKFSGMMRFEAREAIIDHLDAEGLYRGRKEHSMVLPICNRSGDIIEPRILPQWWMKCQDLATKAANAVRSGTLKVLPVEAEKIWFNWMENCRDWCLSRQLWWGHRIPAYSIKISISSENPTFVHQKWIAARSEDEALKMAMQEFPDAKDIRVEQDSDVLDTWFSSALWPFATLGWPNCSSEDLKRFYPASVLETGRDIIFFWVARMVMMGIHLTNQVPFKLIYLHSIVRDAHGRKMSKSLGNVIDPIDVIEGISLEDLHRKLEEGNLDPAEITRARASQKKDFPKGIEECGSDALRFALLAYTSQGSDVNLDIQRVVGYRRFCNKVWNFAKFVFSVTTSSGDNDASLKYQPSFLIDAMATSQSIAKDTLLSFSLFDKWILSRLHTTIIDISTALEEFNFMKATTAIYSFILYDVCDLYLEALKPLLSGPSGPQKELSVSLLFLLLDQSLKMLHPFMPFITEELWQKMHISILKNEAPHEESISLASYPSPNAFMTTFRTLSMGVDGQIARIKEVVHASRSIANDLNAKSITVSFNCNDAADDVLLKENSASIASLIKGVKSIAISYNSEETPGECLSDASTQSTMLFQCAESTASSTGIKVTVSKILTS